MKLRYHFRCGLADMLLKIATNGTQTYKDPLQVKALHLWLGTKRHWYRCRKYYICPAPHHQSPNYPPKGGCHTLTWITGHADFPKGKNGIIYGFLHFNCK